MGFDITNVVNSGALNFDFDFIMIVIKGKRMSIVTAEIVECAGEYRIPCRAESLWHPGSALASCVLLGRLLIHSVPRFHL